MEMMETLLMIPGGLEADYSTDRLLNHNPFSPLGVADHLKNCIPPKSKPEEYVPC